MLGLAISLPAILISGPLAGFFLGAWIKANHPSTDWILWFVLAGLAGSAIQTVKIIKRLYKESNES